MRLGSDLEPSWSGLGAVLGPSWGPLGRSWEPLGASWSHLGASWSALGAILGVMMRKAAMLNNYRKTQVRMALGPSKMRSSWLKLGFRWHLDAILRRLGPSSRDDVAKMSSSCRLEAVLEPSWRRLGTSVEVAFSPRALPTCVLLCFFKISS